MYKVENFEVDLMNGVSLEEILNEIGNSKFIKILKEYSKSINEENMEEKVFYEMEDMEILSRFGFEELIG